MELGIGLTNTGNSCYLNSALQLLGLVDSLHAYAHSNKLKDDILLRLGKEPEKQSEGEAILWWGELLKHMHQPHAKKFHVNPKPLRDWMSKINRTWGTFDQQDAQEALGFLIDQFSSFLGRPHQFNAVTNEVNRQFEKIADESWRQHYEKQYSIFEELFHGQEHIITECKSCKHQNHRFDPFLFCLLDTDKTQVENIQNVEPWLRPWVARFESENLDDYKCDGCKKVGTSHRNHHWWRAPPYLFTVWKSFTGSRITPQFTLPKEGETVRLRVHPDMKEPVEYILLGFIYHIGGMHGGHYTMVRVPSPEWGNHSIWIDDHDIRGWNHELLKHGRVYVGLWKKKDYMVEQSTFWQKIAT